MVEKAKAIEETESVKGQVKAMTKQREEEHEAFKNAKSDDQPNGSKTRLTDSIHGSKAAQPVAPKTMKKTMMAKAMKQ